MNKTGKMMLLGLVLATGISNVTHGWWGWRGGPALSSWRIRNNSDSPLRITNDGGNALVLQPKTDGLLPRPGSFGISVEDLSTGQSKAFSTADEVVIFYYDSRGTLRISTYGTWDTGIGWRFGPFAVGWWGGLGRRWWGPGYGRLGWGRKGYGRWGHRGRGHRRGRRGMHGRRGHRGMRGRGGGMRGRRGGGRAMGGAGRRGGRGGGRRR